MATSASPTPGAVGVTAIIGALLRGARPKQWTKNVLVFTAPLAAGVLGEADQIGRALIAFVAFCLVASGTYFFNDALDAEADRHHPVKSLRPVAAGQISLNAANTAAVVLVLAGIAVSFAARAELAAVVGGYVLLSVSYSIWLKHEAVIDLGAVAAGFVLRAIAGGIACDVPLSNWFLIVAGAGSLFIVTGKRHAEQLDLGDAHEHHRSTLAEYSTGFLGHVRAVASSVAVTGYCLWAFERAAAVGDETWLRISIVPFVLAMLRYALIVEQGRGGAPEEIVAGDRVLQVLGALWIAIFAIGVYV